MPQDQSPEGKKLPDHPAHDPEDAEQDAQPDHHDVDEVHGVIIAAAVRIFKRLRKLGHHAVTIRRRSHGASFEPYTRISGSPAAILRRRLRTFTAFPAMAFSSASSSRSIGSTPR